MGLSSPNAAAARALIRSEIRRLETFSNLNADEATWWIWHHKTGPLANPGPGKLVTNQHPSTIVNKLAIHRLAATLQFLGVPTVEDQQTELIYWLETATIRAGAVARRWDEISTENLSDTLAKAIHDDHLAAATTCAAQLGRRADVAALSSVGGQRSSLATALAHPNRELRYAALEAIMKIKPQQTFAGASGVSPALWHFATSAAEKEKQPEHTEQAAAALGWLAELLETGHPYDEMLRDAKQISLTLYQPELTEATLRVLAVLGTADSQQLLLNFISTNTLPIESRRTASQALATSVKRFGKLLTSGEILRQYDRYNASETADSDTQEVLSEVLDLLEK